MRRKGFAHTIVIVGIIAFLLVIGAGITIASFAINKSNPKPSPTPTAIVTNTPSSLQAGDFGQETIPADCVSYTNSKYKYTLKYPPDLELCELHKQEDGYSNYTRCGNNIYVEGQEGLGESIELSNQKESFSELDDETVNKILNEEGLFKVGVTVITDETISASEYANNLKNNKSLKDTMIKEITVNGVVGYEATIPYYYSSDNYFDHPNQKIIV